MKLRYPSFLPLAAFRSKNGIIFFCLIPTHSVECIMEIRNFQGGMWKALEVLSIFSTFTISNLQSRL